jgi:hypothetical protein
MGLGEVGKPGQKNEKVTSEMGDTNKRFIECITPMQHRFILQVTLGVTAKDIMGMVNRL